jgi:FkbM family methyltransferase
MVIDNLKNEYRIWRLKTRNILSRFIDIEPYIYDYFPKKVLQLYLPKNPVILDCGAHDGTDSIELIEILGGSLHAIEAVPQIYKGLLYNVAGFKNIHTYNLVLGANNGKINFYVSHGNNGASSSFLKPKLHMSDHPEITFEETIELPCLMLDEWAAQNNIKKIDFMWLDMQGAEKLVINASKTIIKTVKAIFCEVSTRETYESVAVYDEFKKFMKGIGFRPEIEVIPNGTDMGDVLFVRYK